MAKDYLIWVAYKTPLKLTPPQPLELTQPLKLTPLLPLELTPTPTLRIDTFPNR